MFPEIPELDKISKFIHPWDISLKEVTHPVTVITKPRWRAILNHLDQHIYFVS